MRVQTSHQLSPWRISTSPGFRSSRRISDVYKRQADVLFICYEGYGDCSEFADSVIALPQSNDLFAPLLSIIPMQLFAYYVALLKGCDVDKPRNLAKSVTVE